MSKLRKCPSGILAISSPGGHWRQLMKLKDAWGEQAVFYATARKSDLDHAGVNGVVIADGSRRSFLRLIRLGLQFIALIRSQRPRVVVTTGAAPGLVGLVIGKVFGARTVWIDSVANVKRMSLSGRLARPFADVWLTQWQHLEQEFGPMFLGGVL